MPERLSAVGRRHQRRLAGLPPEPDDTASPTGTPLQHILAGQQPMPDIDAPGRMPPTTDTPGETAAVLWINVAPDTPEPPKPTPQPRPLPEPANDGEIDHLRHLLRSAIHDKQFDTDRLAALHQALDRARAQRQAEEQGVSEAEATLREVKLHSRGALVAAFVNGEDTRAPMSEADAQAALQIRRDHYRHAREIVEALNLEIAEIENGLRDHDHRVAAAAGRLLIRSPQFIGLVQQIYDAYATLRDNRIIIRDIQRVVHLDTDLVSLAESAWPADGFRRGGFSNDETMVADWVSAVSGLLSDGDAPLPSGPTGTSTPTTTNNPSASPDRGGPAPPRPPASSAAVPATRHRRRSAARKRVSGKQ